MEHCIEVCTGKFYTKRCSETLTDEHSFKAQTQNQSPEWKSMSPCHFRQPSIIFLNNCVFVNNSAKMTFIIKKKLQQVEGITEITFADVQSATIAANPKPKSPTRSSGLSHCL